MSHILEIVMLVCFAAAWPSAVYKSFVIRTRKGQSLEFLVIILIGYISGIFKVILSGQAMYLLIPYSINTTLVTCSLLIYYRNYRIDEGYASLFGSRRK